MRWQKQKPIEAGKTVCSICNCGAHDSLNMESLLGVGFGDVTVMRDNDRVYSEMEYTRKNDGEIWEASDAEKMAASDPDHDWRITFYGPLWGGTYQRHGENHWVLIEKDEGFA